VTNEIKGCLKNLPESMLVRPPRILNKFDSDKAFSEQQKDLIGKIGESFYQVFIYIYTCIYIYIYTYICIYMYIYMYICNMYICICNIYIHV
jgi:hypothetical protein